MEKAIFFDFDGTLTKASENTWKTIWKTLGYSIGDKSYYRKLRKAFNNKQIDYQEWCDLTSEAFKKKKLKHSTLTKISENINLIDGAEACFKKLKELGYSLHIISGNIDVVIDNVLGNLKKYFSSICTNKFVFDKSGYLNKIIGSKANFEGKGQIISDFARKNMINSKNIVFIGNGKNDEWAYTSGCKTICINPNTNTDYNNRIKWNITNKNLTNLTQIIEYL